MGCPVGGKRNRGEPSNGAHGSGPEDVGQRRIIRSRYLAFKSLISGERDDILKADSKKFASIINEVESLHQLVQKPREQVSDAEALLDITNTLVMSVKAHKNEGITPSDFVTCILREFGQEGRASSSTSTEDGGNCVAWKDIGLTVSHILRRAPGCCTMLGPMNTEPKQRKTVVRKKRVTPTESARPEELDDPDAEEKRDTDKNMAVMFNILRKNKKARLESLVLNKKSFSQTVENVFALSFLVKDGRVEIAVNEKGWHIVSPRNAPAANSVASGEVSYSHFVFRFDFRDWKLMLDYVGDGEVLMPHRNDEILTSDSQMVNDSQTVEVPEPTQGKGTTTPIRKLSRNRGLVLQEQTVEDSPECDNTAARAAAIRKGKRNGLRLSKFKFDRKRPDKQMEVRIPTELIRNVQLRLRAQAGLPGNDPTLPAVPTVRHSVAALDPSPPHLRCRHCHGRLLRGPHSAVCVYCGGYQTREAPPEPLRFTSTLGCRWLLRSLELDGSEIIEPSADEQVQSRSQSTPNNKIPLSDLLNLEIPWSAEPEVIEHSLSKNASTDSKRSSNLAGADLDNLFTYAKDLVSDLEKEQAAAGKQIEIMKFNAFAGHENPSLPLNIQQVATAVSPSAAKDNDCSSGWEADFHSADSVSRPEPSKSLGRFASSTADLSADMVSVFRSLEHLKDNKPKDVSTPSVSATGDWTRDDLWNSSNFLPSHVAQQAETDIEVKGHASADYTNPSTSTDWFLDDQWQTHSIIPTGNKPTGGDDNSFDVRNNFTVSSNPQDLSKCSSNATEIKPSTAVDDSSDIWDEFTSSSNAQDHSKSSFNSIKINAATGDDDSSDVWDDFTSSSNAQDPFNSSFPPTGINATAADADSSDLWNGSSAQDPSKISFLAASEIKATSGEDDSSNVWDGFTSSSNAYDPLQNSVTATEDKLTTGIDDLSDVWNDFTSSSKAQDPSISASPATGIKATTIENVSSDDWDAFTSYSAAHDPFNSSVTTTDNKPTTGNAQDPSHVPFAATDNKPTTGEHDSSSVWDVFTSSSKAEDPFKSSVTSTDHKPTTGVDDSSDAWDGFTSSSNAHDASKSSTAITEKKPITGLGDSSDFWSDFSSSSNVQNPSMSSTNSIMEIAAAGEQTSDTMFPSLTKNIQEMDFGSFSQSDFYFGSNSGKNGAMELNNMPSEVFTSNRMASDEVDSGNATIAAKGDGFNSAVKAEDDLENLFSQMHDLSFMLKTELSVPSAKNDPSPSQDLRPSS